MLRGWVQRELKSSGCLDNLMYTDNGGNHAMIWLCYRLPLFFQGILYKQRPIFLLLHLCNLLSQLALFLEVCNRRSIFILPCHRNVFKLLN